MVLYKHNSKTLIIIKYTIRILRREKLFEITLQPPFVAPTKLHGK